MESLHVSVLKKSESKIGIVCEPKRVLIFILKKKVTLWLPDIDSMEHAYQPVRLSSFVTFEQSVK